MTMNREGRPTRPEAAEGSAPATWTGNRALMLEEPLLFEIGDTETTGVDVETGPAVSTRLGGLERNRPIGLAGLSEPQAVRHYTRLSRQNYAIDLGLFPLGSCTMKHNPRLNEKVARMPGFADIHPLQPVDTVQGALKLIADLGEWLVKLTGMHSVAMSPKAGAHGELCGLLGPHGDGSAGVRLVVPLDDEEIAIDLADSHRLALGRRVDLERRRGVMAVIDRLAPRRGRGTGRRSRSRISRRRSRPPSIRRAIWVSNAFSSAPP